MAENINLDDPNQTTFTIPFTGDDDDSEDLEVPFPRPLKSEYDLPEGEKLRIDAYTAAWKKCLDRIQSIVRALHEPIVSKVEHEIHTSYDRALPGLPYPEIPIIGITDPTSSSTFLDGIATLTDSFDLDDRDASNTIALTSHLYPTDCNNVMSAMKAIIGGFVNKPNLIEKGNGRSGISLANYDLETLLAWYIAIRDTYDFTEQCQPKLVVLLHDFEQLDPLVVQDVLSISSLYIPRLPLVFILAMSSPASPSYLHSTYPRSTLVLLRFTNYTVPSGGKVLEEILLRTFFDPEFEPEIVIGPGVLAYLADYYNRHDSSVDAALNILQLAHLRHFSTEPLTLVVRSTPSPETLSQDTSVQFVEELLIRHKSFKPSSNSDERDWSQQPISSLIAATDNARSALYSRACGIRIGFRIIKLIQDFMTSQGYKGLDWDNPVKGIGIVDVMISALQGGLGSDVKYLGIMIKKLKVSQLAILFDNMHAFFDSLPLGVRTSEGEARTNLEVAINALPPQGDDDVTGASSQVAANLADWLVKYLNDLLTPLENVPLWDIWYTGQASFPSSLINPSVRATVVSGLLHPHDFTEQTRSKDEEQTDPALWELPDTSILFRRYLDSGKMLNVYDWFTAFQQELETQRKNLKERALAAKSRQSSSPRKRSAKGRMKEIEKPESEEEMERWQLQVQARFIRALQDLDYLGFLKHTGRKADHVQRVVFDMYD